ncbi:hypothetical protein WJX81_006678 [Elliptochloris bilobata]|uniref:Uncharacterized protein n=1 Tax=Elliptochloris bilobata TaxID=381761 RepID=A0AAW1SLV5_9CHLO
MSSDRVAWQVPAGLSKSISLSDLAEMKTAAAAVLLLSLAGCLELHVGAASHTTTVAKGPRRQLLQTRTFNFPVWCPDGPASPWTPSNPGQLSNDAAGSDGAHGVFPKNQAQARDNGLAHSVREH